MPWAGPELWIAQSPVGRGVKATERVAEYQIESEELRAAARPAAAGGRRRGMGRVPLLNIVDDVTMWSCSLRPPQEACVFEEGDRTRPGLDHPETA